jgi:hypothetical protein
MNTWRAKGSTQLIRPELIQTGLYRQFNNASFDHGGRLYGGWWISVPEHMRQKIFINGKPTVELDYSGCAIRMLYHERNLECPDDPYSIAPIVAHEAASGLPEGYYREAIKTLTQALINGSNRNKDMMCSLPDGRSFAPRFKRKQVMQMIEDKHAAIADTFGSGAGTKLQRKDSDLAIGIIKKLADKSIIALPIHDSFIVSEENENELRKTMTNEYRAMFNHNPVID